MPNARFRLIPESADTRGHGTHTWARSGRRTWPTCSRGPRSLRDEDRLRARGAGRCRACPAAAIAQQDRPAYVRAHRRGIQGVVRVQQSVQRRAERGADRGRRSDRHLRQRDPAAREARGADRPASGARCRSLTIPPCPRGSRRGARRLGCTTLPIGASADAIAALPRIEARAPDLDARRWPMGDRDAVGRAPAALRTAVAKAFDRRSYGQGSETTAVLVVRGWTHRRRAISARLHHAFVAAHLVGGQEPRRNGDRRGGPAAPDRRRRARARSRVEGARRSARPHHDRPAAAHGERAQ